MRQTPKAVCSNHSGRPWHQRHTASSLRPHGEGPRLPITISEPGTTDHALQGGVSFCCPLLGCRALWVWAGVLGLREVCCLEAEPPPETRPHCTHHQKVHSLGSAQPDRVPDKILPQGGWRSVEGSSFWVRKKPGIGLRERNKALVFKESRGRSGCAWSLHPHPVPEPQG